MAKIRTSGTDDAGYTLLEMLIVLAISALAVSATLPLIVGARPATELAAATDTAVSALREARASAIRLNRPVPVQFDLRNRTVASTGGAPVELGGEWLSLELTTAREFIGDQEVGAIVFLPDGSSTGGRVSLSTEQLSRAIVVDWITGRVREERGENGQGG